MDYRRQMFLKELLKNNMTDLISFLMREYHINKTDDLIDVRDGEDEQSSMTRQVEQVITNFLSTAATPVAPVWYCYILFIIAVVGICGNILNLLVLVRRLRLASISSVERSSTRLLMAIALSDVFFCCTILPAVIYTDEPYTQPGHKLYVLFYKIYGVPLINVFLVSSTYFIVLTAMMRYFAVSSPLRSRSRSNCFIRRTGLLSIFICLIVLLLMLPQFLSYEVVQLTSYGDGMDLTEYSNKSTVVYSLGAHFEDHRMAAINFYVSHLLPFPSSFLPCLLLTIFNVGLICQLRRARKARSHVVLVIPGAAQQAYKGGGAKNSNNRLNITLIVMFCSHVILVVPSDVAKYLSLFNKNSNDDGYGLMTGDIVACGLNLAQACNFALNFVLYVSLNSSFRKNLKATVLQCLCCCSSRCIDNAPYNGRAIEVESLRRSSSTPRLLHNISNSPSRKVNNTTHPQQQKSNIKTSL